MKKITVISFLLFLTLVCHTVNPLIWQLPSQLIKQPLRLTGTIYSIPKLTTRSARFLFKTISHNVVPKNTLLSLSWYGKIPPLKFGQSWQLTVKLKPPHGLLNPGGHDFSQWLKRQGISATGYVFARGKNRLLTSDLTVMSINRIRERIYHAVLKSIKNPAVSGLISALTVGVRASMNKNIWRVLQATGTSHLMAISGLHVGLVAAVIFCLVGFLWRRSPRLMQAQPAQHAALVVSLLIGILYALLAGFSLPTQRAAVMLMVFVVAQLCYRHLPLWQRLGVAFLLIVLWQPMAIFTASLWLSFLAVGWIAFGMQGYGQQSKWRIWLRVQWVVFCGLMPVTLWFFHQLSLAMLLANAVAIPWVSFLVLPLALLGVVTWVISNALGMMVFTLTGWIMWPLWWVLMHIADWPWVVWRHSVANPWVFASSMVGMGLLLMPAGLPGRGLAIAWLLPLFFYQPARPAKGAVWMTVLDVGQGLAVVVQTAKHNLVYDAGPAFYQGFDAGDQVVGPFLRFAGIKQLNSVIISHPDLDHRGGLKALLRQFVVQQLLTSTPKRWRKAGAQYCYAGQHWQWDGVDFSMLAPTAGAQYHGNDSSCVLKIQAGRASVLLPGDIESTTESSLLAHHASRLASTVLVAPHHGSKTSSTPAFVQAVHPRYVIFATGYLNRFRFPSQVVVNRFKKNGSKMYNTAVGGAIKVRISARGTVTCQAMRSSERVSG